MMDTLCWTYGFRVFIDHYRFPNPGNTYYLFPNSNSKPHFNFNIKRSTYRYNPHHTPRSGIYASSTVDSHATHLAVAEPEINPKSTELFPPFPDSGIPVSFHSTHHLWGALEIAEAVCGEIMQWGPSGTISTDTRKLIPGQWFFALTGPNFDAHNFIDRSLADDKGCIGVIGNRVCNNWPGGFVKVEGDTMIALDNMARYARNRFRGSMIGLTGSVGKTTTRTMIALALESLGHIYQTQENFNYMVGVALTVTGVPLDAPAAVVELGMSGREGEILKMARMCRPSVRVVLNVGHCHMKHFSSLHDVARAKGELLTEAEPGDICVLNADDPLVMSIPVPVGVKKVLFGRRIGCDVRLVSAECVDGGRAVYILLESRMAGERKDMVGFKIHGPGLHLAVNACAAAAVALSLQVPLTQIGNSLSRFRPVHMRSQMEVSQNGITIINDTYNASLTSMIAAINSLTSIDCSGQRVAILGDMLELGEAEASAHEMVLKLCCDASLDAIMLAGERFLSAAKSLNFSGRTKIICAPDSVSLAAKVSEFVAPADVVLVKGSRGMKMEKIVEVIKVISG